MQKKLSNYVNTTTDGEEHKATRAYNALGHFMPWPGRQLNGLGLHDEGVEAVFC